MAGYCPKTQLHKNNLDIQTIKQRFGIIGTDSKLERAIFTAMQVAPTDISVLIMGESGTGKEVFSQIIHQLSPRHKNGGKFIAVNCGAIPEGTIDSELFGHEKGSFTGAAEKRVGYFEAVNGGSIFLDEIGEMPLTTQARLLRVLETGEYIKVGSSKPEKTDVRVIAASNINFDEAINKGKFREDLFYRLNTVVIHIPALRQRPNDIPLLFRKFASDFAEKYRTEPIRLDDAAQELLKSHSWQGNVRQLKNVVEQISVLEKNKLLQGDQLLQYLPLPRVGSQVPMLNSTSSAQNEFSERDILFKFLFEMKKDLNELKNVVKEIVQQQNIPISHPNFADEIIITPPQNPTNIASGYTITSAHKHLDIQDLEETLSLHEREKQAIESALKKYNGKRKNAALELGISERTLYRKINEYNLENEISK